MRKLINLNLFAIICILFTNCNKCTQQQIAYLQFSSEELNINPYSGNEILIFKDSVGDSVVFPKGIRNTEVSKHYQFDEQTADLDHHGCQGDYYYKSTNSTIKHFATGNILLDIKLSFYYTFSNPSTDRCFNLYFSFDSISNFCFQGYYKFKPDSLITDPLSGDAVVIYYKSLTIGPKTFQNVYQLSGDKLSVGQEWLPTAFYSMQSGLVGFKTNLGRIWYFDKLRK